MDLREFQEARSGGVGKSWKLTATANLPRNCGSDPPRRVRKTESSTFLLPLRGSLWRPLVAGPPRASWRGTGAICRATFPHHRLSPETTASCSAQLRRTKTQRIGLGWDTNSGVISGRDAIFTNAIKCLELSYALQGNLERHEASSAFRLLPKLETITGPTGKDLGI